MTASPIKSDAGNISRKDFLRASIALVGAAIAQQGWPRVQAAERQSPSVAADKFAGKILADTATTMLSMGVYIGDRLGIYQAMADTGPATTSVLAAKTLLNERYLKEWLALMTTAGYILYDPRAFQYRLPGAHATVLCDQNSPYYMGGFVEILACVLPINKIIEGFRGGKGPRAEDYLPELWEGVEKSTAPSYRHFLVQSYLPAMPDIVARLRKGGAALDLGCGGGLASIAVAKAYPAAEVFGLDVYAPSIEKARENAKAAGVGARIHFDTYDGFTLTAGRYDLITIFYTVHHLTDPIKVLASARKALRKGGSLLVMEANIPEKLENSIGDTYANWNYGASLFNCMSQVLTEGGPGYGAAIKGSEIRELGRKAGFQTCRRLPIQNQYDALYEFKLGRT
jgi:2-polyprenyl-3-methyl-5-hydroxy-6-metoxy-1,4-benzoquinol methylase